MFIFIIAQVGEAETRRNKVGIRGSTGLRGRSGKPGATSSAELADDDGVDILLTQVDLKLDEKSGVTESTISNQVKEVILASGN